VPTTIIWKMNIYVCVRLNGKGILQFSNLLVSNSIIEAYPNGLSSIMQFSIYGQIIYPIFGTPNIIMAPNNNAKTFSKLSFLRIALT
jgi:hypothetical protein